MKYNIKSYHFAIIYTYLALSASKQMRNNIASLEKTSSS